MMTRRMMVMLIVVGVIFAGFFGWQTLKSVMIAKFMASRASTPQTVSTAVASVEPWQPSLKSVGTLRAAKGTDISPQLAGVVADIPFKSDDDVKAGDLLVQLADADDVAQLNALKASAELARLTYERNRELVKKGNVSQSALDSATASYRSATAQVAQQQALVDKKRIVAPFDGRVGIRLVDVGQYLSAGTKVTTLQALDPIYIDFTVPQQSIRLIAVGQNVGVTTDAFPGVTFGGKITAIDAKVDPETRNVAVRAELANHDRKLLPGMFASINILIGEPQQVLTLPQTAITYNPYGETVFLVKKGEPDASGKPTLIAAQKFVTVGETRGDQVTILSGVGPGDTVVSSGQLKIKNGTPLAINNSVQLPNDPAPTPQDQ
ncbi:efflux RND transporter periplasmic adaptor subunit [Parvibaculum sp.]|uniref:efflux RND transporter periplasmic adaptor subunit n=1 Tax=Parvibaculum sp. TaxID=2024848 RepID=UPI002852B31F|nr:efflux RND transporter periplasmic adaptor subunit [Parvibaculum sp.]